MSAAPVSLWAYAIEVYTRPGVKERLLKLQDRYYLDVNILLWCLWCGRYGFGFEADEVEAIFEGVRDMSLHAVKPLRNVRRFLSSPREGFTDAEFCALRDEVLRLEITAEEMVLRRLGQLTEAAADPNPELGDMQLRAERLFTLAREAMDRPTMIADEEGPLSPAALFASVCRQAEDEGP
ncbi:TIGR02444 family protein [Parvularcula maris]|uniref:TIGR02444 family protein n=1 Tax=Parvularcula maris TaxID=2965077 RepID=A0A9X2RIT1_9PROT|nr:TIGR02444 family protein [Parvularcula maris]MCQ8186420.1 TIGR02444 family protein [Parvularcula maris]